MPTAIPFPDDPPKRSLGVAMSEEAAAIQQDLQQAGVSATSLEAQLAGKSKELLHLKFLLTNAKTRFDHLQDCVVILRKERHELANEVMRAQGLDLLLERTTGERDRLRLEVQSLLEGLAQEATHRNSLNFDQRDHQIAQLTMELYALKTEVAELRKQKPSPPPALAPIQPSIVIGSEDSMETIEIVPTDPISGRKH